MGDAEAFETFVGEEMVSICGAENFNVRFRGDMHRIESVFYKWLRCELAHAGSLPSDVHFVRDQPSGGRMISVEPSSGLTLGHGWLIALIDVVINAPENRDQFGDSSTLPLPLYLPGFDVTLNMEQISEDDDVT